MPSNQTLRFNVGPWVYTLRIASEPILRNGQECLGLCKECDREILIAGDCPLEQRLPTLIHELAHAWVFATGQPRSLEEWCDLCGTVTASVMRDLAQVGGEGALGRLRPGRARAKGVRLALAAA